MFTQEAHTLLGEIDAKVDILLERSGVHDKSIRALERRQWFQAGAVAACVAVVVPKLRVILGV